MDLNQRIKKEIVSLLAKQKIKIKPEDLETPPSAEMGDFGMPCFNLAKEMKKSPIVVAKELAKQIKPAGLIINIKAVGPYLNFWLDFNKASELIIKEISKQKNKYGQNKSGKGVKVMIEFSALNTHKEIHVGHLRNICIGASLVNIYRLNGYKVLGASYLGDTGAHVAKTLWYLQNYVNQTDYPHGKRELGEFLGKSYTRAVAVLSSGTKVGSTSDNSKNQILSEIEERNRQASEVLKKLEDGDPQLTNLWKQTRQWSLDLFAEVFKELGIKFDLPYFFESEEEKAGKKILPKLMKYPFIRKSEGAIIADLEKYNLGVLVLLRKDGTALYGIKDIPLAIKKFKKYNVKKSLYIIDIRQSQYLAQIFKILELMGFKKDMVHVPYQYVQLKSGMISSRTGNVVTYEEVKEASLAHAISETKKRHADWSDDKVLEVSTKIVMAALKFGMLKNGNDKIITFDVEEALDAQGLTGPYLQYTMARINSILKKIEPQPKQAKADYKHLGASIEKTLIKDLIKYPEISVEALKINDPSVIAQYLCNLSQNFNAFYHELPILKAEPEIMMVRLQLIEAVKQVLTNGLELLGIPTVEEM